MAKEKNKGRITRDKTVLVSFKLSHELYEQLSLYAKGQTDESGLQLSPSLAARRLMLDALKRIHLKK